MPTRTRLLCLACLAGAIVVGATACRTTAKPQNTPPSIESLFQESRAASERLRFAPPPATPAPNPIAQITTLRRLPPVATELQQRPQASSPIALVNHLEPLRVTEVESLPLIKIEPAANSVRVSETFIDTDIRQALHALAAQADVSIVLDQEVNGMVTAMIENEPFELALRKLILPLGLVSRLYEGQYLIGPPNPNSALFPLLAERFDYLTQHRTSTELLELLPDRHQVFLRTSGAGNLIIVEAPEEIATRILEHLRRSDTPVPQVVLEAMVCVYSPETSFRFGFDIQQGVSINGGNAVNLATSGLALSGQFGPSSVTDLNDFTFTTTFLRALEQNGYLTIRAAPRVMAKNGEKANISIGRETFFSVQPSSGDLVIRQEIERVESGIMLEITPSIRDDRITVKIDRAEVSEDIRTDDSTAALNQYPVINRRRVSTTVHVRDGQTIVIGGLTQQQEVDQLIKTPWLGDMKLVGKLFQRVERQEKEVEVAIFISPQIVREECLP